MQSRWMRCIKLQVCLESLGHIVKPVNPPISDQFLTDFIDVWAMNAFYCHYFGKLMFGPDHTMTDKLSKLTRGLSKHHLKEHFQNPILCVSAAQSRIIDYEKDVRGNGCRFYANTNLISYST